MTAPAAITVACGAITCGIHNTLYQWINWWMSDHRYIQSINIFSAAPGPCGGPVTETWTATDACGRTLASVSRIITVDPAPLPTMTAPAAHHGGLRCDYLRHPQYLYQWTEPVDV